MIKIWPTRQALYQWRNRGRGPEPLSIFGVGACGLLSLFDRDIIAAEGSTLFLT